MFVFLNGKPGLQILVTTHFHQLVQYRVHTTREVKKGEIRTIYDNRLTWVLLWILYAWLSPSTNIM